jgi:hypothetical protein
MSLTTLTDLSPDSLETVIGGNCAGGCCGRKNVAQNGGTGYVDHSHGFGNVIQGGRWDYAAPIGFGGRAASAHGSALRVEAADGVAL